MLGNSPLKAIGSLAHDYLSNVLVPPLPESFLRPGGYPIQLQEVGMIARRRILWSAPFINRAFLFFGVNINIPDRGLKTLLGFGHPQYEKLRHLVTEGKGKAYADTLPGAGWLTREPRDAIISDDGFFVRVFSHRRWDYVLKVHWKDLITGGDNYWYAGYQRAQEIAKLDPRLIAETTHFSELVVPKRSLSLEWQKLIQEKCSPFVEARGQYFIVKDGYIQIRGIPFKSFLQTLARFYDRVPQGRRALIWQRAARAIDLWIQATVCFWRLGYHPRDFRLRNFVVTSDNGEMELKLSDFDSLRETSQWTAEGLNDSCEIIKEDDFSECYNDNDGWYYPQRTASRILRILRQEVSPLLADYFDRRYRYVFTPEFFTRCQPKK